MPPMEGEDQVSYYPGKRPDDFMDTLVILAVLVLIAMIFAQAAMVMM